MSDNMGTLDFKLKDKIRDFKHKDNINGQMSDNMGTLDFKHKDNGRDFKHKDNINGRGGGRFPPSFIHQVIIITGLNKL